VNRAFLFYDVIDHFSQANSVFVGVEAIGLWAELFRIETGNFIGAFCLSGRFLFGWCSSEGLRQSDWWCLQTRNGCGLGLLEIDCPFLDKRIPFGFRQLVERLVEVIECFCRVCPPVG
jgi:hypothetical protein